MGLASYTVSEMEIWQLMGRNLMGLVSYAMSEMEIRQLISDGMEFDGTYICKLHCV